MKSNISGLEVIRGYASAFKYKELLYHSKHDKQICFLCSMFTVLIQPLFVLPSPPLGRMVSPEPGHRNPGPPSSTVTYVYHPG